MLAALLQAEPLVCSCSHCCFLQHSERSTAAVYTAAGAGCSAYEEKRRAKEAEREAKEKAQVGLRGFRTQVFTGLARRLCCCCKHTRPLLLLRRLVVVVSGPVEVVLPAGWACSRICCIACGYMARPQAFCNCGCAAAARLNVLRLSLAACLLCLAACVCAGGGGAACCRGEAAC